MSASGPARQRVAVAREGQLVLLAARDTVLARHLLRRLSHGEARRGLGDRRYLGREVPRSDRAEGPQPSPQRARPRRCLQEPGERTAERGRRRSTGSRRLRRWPRRSGPGECRSPPGRSPRRKRRRPGSRCRPGRAAAGPLRIPTSRATFRASGVGEHLAENERPDERRIHLAALDELADGRGSEIHGSRSRKAVPALTNGVRQPATSATRLSFVIGGWRWPCWPRRRASSGRSSHGNRRGSQC